MTRAWVSDLITFYYTPPSLPYDGWPNGMMVRRGLRNIAFDELQECTKNAMQTILSVQEVGILYLSFLGTGC